jgi:hypothetical protein
MEPPRAPSASVVWSNFREIHYETAILTVSSLLKGVDVNTKGADCPEVRDLLILITEAVRQMLVQIIEIDCAHVSRVGKRGQKRH